MFSIAIPGYCAYNLCKNYGRAGINRCAFQEGVHYDKLFERRGPERPNGPGVTQGPISLAALGCPLGSSRAIPPIRVIVRGALASFRRPTFAALTPPLNFERSIMPDPEITLSGDSEALIAYLLLKIHLDKSDVTGPRIAKDFNYLLDLYRQCLRAVKDQPPQGEHEE